MSGQFLQRSLFVAVDAILCAIDTSHTHRNVTNQPKYGQIINCGLTILIVYLFSVCRIRITTQLRSSAVDKMVDIFTKRIWQPYICQPNELQRKIKKKLEGANGDQAKIWGGMAHPPTLRIATVSRKGCWQNKDCRGYSKTFVHGHLNLN